MDRARQMKQIASTSTPLSKAVPQINIPLSVIRNRSNNSNFTLDDADLSPIRSDAFNARGAAALKKEVPSDRSRSLIELDSDKEEDFRYKGKSDQSMKERERWGQRYKGKRPSNVKRPLPSMKLGTTVVMDSDSEPEIARTTPKTDSPGPPIPRHLMNHSSNNSLNFDSSVESVHMKNQSSEVEVISVSDVDEDKENTPPAPVPKPKLPIPRAIPPPTKVNVPVDNVRKPGIPQFPRPNQLPNHPIKMPQVIPPPSMTDRYQNMIDPEQVKRNFAGKMTMERYEDVRRQTTTLIESIHHSLETMPKEEDVTENPNGLIIDLMHHQKQGLSWLLWREQQKHSAGILADDMGLGKTLSMISLILEQKNRRTSAPDFNEIQRKQRMVCMTKNLIHSNSTLVVAPTSLIFQWEKEIKERLRPGKLTVSVYHGSRRTSSAASLANYDVVITTYGTLTSDVPLENNRNSVLAKVAWERIILDEAHKIKNRKSKISRIVTQLHAVSRWCLTGTPIQNELWDLFSLIRFMKVMPFAEENHWKIYIATGQRNNDRLNTLVKGFLLRRTKNQVSNLTKKPLIELPERNFDLVELEMKGAEGRCYQLMFEASKQKVRQMIEDGDAYHGRRRRKNNGEKVANPFIGEQQIDPHDNFRVMSSILALLLRLRQASVHLSLTKAAVDTNAFKEEGIDEPDEDDMAELEKTLANICLAEDEDQENVIDIDKLFEPEFMSTKIKAVVEAVHEVVQLEEKCIVVSQWTSVLDIVGHHLSRNHIKTISITGQTHPKDRQAIMDSFNNPKSLDRVMLLSLTAGGVGLNLTGGNHLFLVDLHWNPAMEQQAFDRIYRMGQKKDVHIKKFVCKDSIEQRVIQLQQKKMDLAQSVLDGVSSKKNMKMTMNDLKFLFGLDNNNPSSRAKPEVRTTTTNPLTQQNTNF